MYISIIFELSGYDINFRRIDKNRVDFTCEPKHDREMQIEIFHLKFEKLNI